MCDDPQPPPEGVRLWSSHVWQTRSARITTPRGVVLIDPTYFPDEIDNIFRDADHVLRDRPAERRERLAVYTHSDWDHVVAAPRLESWRQVAHRRVAEKPEPAKRKIVEEIAAFDRAWYVLRDRWAYPRIDVPVGDDEAIDLAGEPARAIWTPGHTEDAMALILVERGVMIAGDLLSALEFPFVYHSVRAYRQTLDRVANLIDEHAVRCVIPGHGPIAADPAEIQRRLDDDRRYLADLGRTAFQAVQRGEIDAAGVRSVASEIGFRGQAVPASQGSFHVANIELAMRELAG